MKIYIFLIKASGNKTKEMLFFWSRSPFRHVLGPGLTTVILKLTIPFIGRNNNFHLVKFILTFKASGNNQGDFFCLFPVGPSL